MRKMLSRVIGALLAGSCRPSASNQPIWPRRATSTVTPGMVALSISRLNASDIRPNRVGESPSDSGLDSGSGGVCGVLTCLVAACAFMDVSRLLFLFRCLNKGLSRHGEREIGPEVLA